MEYYDSIHNCTVMAFDRAMSTEDYRHIHLSGKYNEKQAASNWEKIFNEYIAEFGLPEHYVKYLELMVIACDFWAKSVEKGGKHYRLNAKIKEADAKRQLSSTSESINKTSARLSKYMGYVIDPNKITVVQFYSSLKIMQDG